MQNIILALAVVLITNLSAYSQCDKKVTWQASRAELIDTDGQVKDTKEGAIRFTAHDKKITLNIEEASNETLTGDIDETTCEWKEAFKNGKTVYKATLYSPGGNDPSPATITIEAKDGKIEILMEIEKMEGRKVRILVDKYEEVE